jgi:hypothetical protein
MQKVNLAEKLSQFSDYFNSRIAGELNGQQVKLVKFKGEFIIIPGAFSISRWHNRKIL